MQLSPPSRIHVITFQSWASSQVTPAFLSWETGIMLQLWLRAVCSSAKILSSQFSREQTERALCGSPLFIKNCFYVTKARK